MIGRSTFNCGSKVLTKLVSILFITRRILGRKLNGILFFKIEKIENSEKKGWEERIRTHDLKEKGDSFPKAPGVILQLSSPLISLIGIIIENKYNIITITFICFVLSQRY